MDYLKLKPGKKTRHSQPNLHIVAVKQPPQSQSSIESQDSGGTFESSKSTHCPRSYSPASQRSRYSQPNLPTLMIPYDTRLSVSPDRRIRMSQPTLHSSFSGISSMGIPGSRLSYSSLRTSGDTSINMNIQEKRVSTPNVHSYIASGAEAERRLSREYRRGSRLSQPDVQRILKPPDAPGKRERLSQPTLVTGDYYPARMQHQRLSQPCLLTTWSEKPQPLRSPTKLKRFGPAVSKMTQRERMSTLDFGAARFRNVKELQPGKFNRDRFSIPELETQNDLKLMAGTPKQRYSLDSQLNPESNRSRRLLPIASSPISEQVRETGMASEGLEKVIVATATPLIQPSERQFLAPILKSTPPPAAISTRERMSVPEIRNSSLRRLLDPPAKQRHSISGNLRQILGSGAPEVEGDRDKSPEDFGKKSELETTAELEENDVRLEPKHIQRHYSYTYDTKDEPNEVIGKLSVVLPRKKYLESNFDENEQVITTVIETEIPMILSSPKYTKKTHVYASEAPNWMKKCLQENPGKHTEHLMKTNQKNKLAAKEKTARKAGGGHSEVVTDREVTQMAPKEELRSRDTCVRVKSAGNQGESKFEVTINSQWVESDSDSESSTSV